MIKPDVLASELPYGAWSCRGTDVWDAICAAVTGDVAALRRLLARDPNLYRAEYWYTQPIHFAVREGHLEAVRVLLDAGADPAALALDGEDLTTIARDRGHEAVARLLEDVRALRERTAPAAADHPIHDAAAAGDAARVRALLDAEPQLVHRGDRAGRTPLHRAVAVSAREVVRLLLDRGADPNWPEGPGAPRGMALWTAARAGDRAIVELLLAHGADPNGWVDSSGSPTFAARTPELRALLLAHGGTLDAYDLVWLGEDDEAVRRVAADPGAADAGCGGVLAAAAKQGKRDLLVRLLAAGARVPPVVTGCRSYLLSDPGMLRLLLASGMDPDLPNWQRATPLHDLCGRDGRGRPRPQRTECAAILLDAGASISAKDEDYRSTPLAWAARHDLPDMVELLLVRGAPANLPDDEPWATPLAWATRRGHGRIAEILRRAGATA
jgi:ankyrin repeat protein